MRNASSVGADVPLDDQQVLQSVGIYRYHHPLENAAAYKERLTVIEAAVAALVREGRAIERSNMFTFDNSLAKGRKMSDDLSKLMLRAYNAEADSAVRSLRAGNVETAKRRLEKSREAIARLGAMMEMRIALDYHDLRVEEVELTSDWLMRKQEEREFERDERARLREEKRVQQELDAERERLDKERALIEQTIERLRSNGEVDADLEARLSQIDAAIEQNDFRAANIRAGYVYVISNRGAFGPDVVKIGLTRRLEPSDRVNELGGASVPFRFDVHTIYFSEDAVTLETELHRHFATRALNQANPRKEFFFATPAEVREVLMQKVGALLEFREEAEATEYLQSVGAWPTRVVPMS
ncbi:ATPase [Curtobacterium sp. MCBA15_009]|nr:ATPase [Curtobacterium sp. MCBA15_009]